MNPADRSPLVRYEDATACVDTAEDRDATSPETIEPRDGDGVGFAIRSSVDAGADVDGDAVTPVTFPALSVWTVIGESDCKVMV